MSVSKEERPLSRGRAGSSVVKALKQARLNDFQLPHRRIYLYLSPCKSKCPTAHTTVQRHRTCACGQGRLSRTCAAASDKCVRAVRSANHDTSRSRRPAPLAPLVKEAVLPCHAAAFTAWHEWHWLQGEAECTCHHIGVRHVFSCRHLISMPSIHKAVTSAARALQPWPVWLQYVMTRPKLVSPSIPTPGYAKATKHINGITMRLPKTASVASPLATMVSSAVPTHLCLPIPGLDVAGVTAQPGVADHPAGEEREKIHSIHIV